MINNIPTICSFCNTGCGMFIRMDREEALSILPITHCKINCYKKEDGGCGKQSIKVQPA